MRAIVRYSIMVISQIIVALIFFQLGIRHAETKSTETSSPARIGKRFTLVANSQNEITASSVRVGKYNLDLLDTSVRTKLAKFMESHHLHIKAGTDTLSQANSYEECLAELSFINID